MKENIRRFLARVPGAIAARGLVRERLLARRTSRRRFVDAYSSNYWRGDESRSGRGSSLTQTAAIRCALPSLLRDIGVHSVLDVPCGDFHWMRLVDLGGIAYTGADIVPALIAENTTRYGRPGRSFVVLDIASAVPPRADLVLCRDLLVHLTFRDMARVVRNIRRSGSTWLLTTTFVARSENEDLRDRDWRPINLQMPPIGLPRPVLLIDERCSEDGGDYSDKSLGLWRIESLP